MCGRFALKTPLPSLREVMHFDNTPEAEPRYNIAPSQEVLVVRQADQARVAEWMRWGLIPRWANDPAVGNRLINARAETVAEKPAFREAFRRRRCLIPADGFYEWQAGRGQRKLPYFLHRSDGKPLAFAGIWEQWSSPDGREISSCAIITVDATGQAAEIHHRMPAILPAGAWDAWLSPRTDPADLEPLLQPTDAPALKAYAVDPQVNAPQADHPGCIEPIGQGSDFPERLF